MSHIYAFEFLSGRGSMKRPLLPDAKKRRGYIPLFPKGNAIVPYTHEFLRRRTGTLLENP